MLPPIQPELNDYYEPWTYEYDRLLSAPKDSPAIPVARAKSQLDGRYINQPEWGPNWDDNLGGSMETLDQDPILSQMNLSVKKDIESTLHVLPAAYLRALPQPYLRVCLPLGRPCISALRTALCW